MLAATLGQLAAGHDLSSEEMVRAMEFIMDGGASAGEIGLFLLGLRDKGETYTEVAAAAKVMRQRMTRIRSQRDNLIDTCGTGGDGAGTFNISTAAALVTAAAGVPVAKHGNRKVSSTTGSADVLRQLGVNVEADVATVEACLEEVGVCFCFAPLLHSSMKHVADVRRELGVPTIFNIVGPLTNPAECPYQLIGVGRAELRPLLAKALGVLGARRAFVVHGQDGLDELTLAAATDVSEAANPSATERVYHEHVWAPEDFGLSRASLQSICVEGPEESAAMIQGVLDGNPGPAREITVLNAAASLYTVGKFEDPLECAVAAAEAIDSGQAALVLRKLADRTNS
ncbi:MAG: anthranilate phosphoribosyltransferase [Pirellulales bacterium]|nr:anthranilate phosphoribosyltransferase [Pirellulales bacterium]